MRLADQRALRLGRYRLGTRGDFLGVSDMSGNLSFEALKEEVQLGAIDTVLAVQVDMQGRLMGKRFEAGFFVENAYKETHSCNYLLATDIEMYTVPGYKSTSWEKGYGDYTMVPDLATLRRIPWLEGTALVICDVQDHHTYEEVAIAPRTILKRQIARAEAKGFRPTMASELELFLFKDSFEAALAKGYRGIEAISAYNEDYHIFQTTKEEHVMRAIRNGLKGAGIPIENTKGEAEAGQEEINVTYADALTMADNHSVIKHGAKEIAWAAGHAITFLAKYRDDRAGSSSHIHQSLQTLDGQPAFFDADADAEHGMSKIMRHYLAGLLTHAHALTYFLAPYINSYKRFQPGTFAPTKAIWSLDNRTAGYRLVAANSRAVRVECRVGGSDLNPYLAMAALIAAGLDGIEKELKLEAAFAGDAYEAHGAREVPLTLREALTALDRSLMLRQAFGDEVVEHYLHAGRFEQHEYDRRVTDWEVARGFERA